MADHSATELQKYEQSTILAETISRDEHAISHINSHRERPRAMTSQRNYGREGRELQTAEGIFSSSGGQKFITKN